MSKAVTAAKAVEHVAENTASNAVELVQNIHPVQKAAKVKKLSRFVPKAVSRRSGRTLLVVSKHSPTILFGVGVVGFVGTTVLAAKATLGLEDVLDEDNALREKARIALEQNVPSYGVKEYNKDLTIITAKTTVKIVKLYGPSVLVGAATIAALAGSHKILSTRNAGLTAAYAALDKATKDYQKRVAEEIGEDRERELRFPTTEVDEIGPHPDDPSKIQGKKVDKTENPSKYSIYAKTFNRENSRNWQTNRENNLFYLQCQQRYANDLLVARGHVTLNDVYDSLGFERTKAGQLVGWLLGKGNINYIDFGIFENGRDGDIVLDFNVDGLIFDKLGNEDDDS